jgi:hypothetical protein
MTLINTKEDIVVSGLDTLQDLIDTYKSDRKYSNDQSVREYYNKNILPKDHNTTYEDINQFRSLIV